MKRLTIPRCGVLLVVVSGILFPAAVPPAAESQEAVVQYLKAHSCFLEAENLYAQAESARATAALEECLQIFPRHDGAHFLLACIRLKQRRLADADIHIREAKENFLELKEWYRGPFRKYLDELRKKQVDNRNRIPILEERKGYVACQGDQQLTHVIRELRSENTAIESLLSAFSSRGEKIPAEYHYIHGNVHFLSGRYRAALTEYVKTLEKNPRHGYACNNLANLYFQLKQYGKAREYLDKAVLFGAKVNPRFREALEKVMGKSDAG